MENQEKVPEYMAEARLRVMDGFRRWLDGDLRLEELSPEARVNLELDFKLAEKIIDYSADMMVAEFRTKNAILLGL